MGILGPFDGRHQGATEAAAQDAARKGKNTTQFCGGPGSVHAGLQVGPEGAGELGPTWRFRAGEGDVHCEKVDVGRGLLVFGLVDAESGQGEKRWQRNQRACTRIRRRQTPRPGKVAGPTRRAVGAGLPCPGSPGLLSCRRVACLRVQPTERGFRGCRSQRTQSPKTNDRYRGDCRRRRNLPPRRGARQGNGRGPGHGGRGRGPRGNQSNPAYTSQTRRASGSPSTRGGRQWCDTSRPRRIRIVAKWRSGGGSARLATS